MPIPSFRHLEDESLLLDERIEEEAGRFLGVVKGVYREIGPGLKESIDQEALEMALSEAGIPFLPQPKLRVLFRGRVLKRCAVPDLLAGDHLVVELKAVEQMHAAHLAQLVTYLRIAKRPLGFVVSFNAPRLSEGIKRRVVT